AGGRDGGLDLVVRRDVHLGHDRAVRGVDHGAARAVARGDPRTVDVQVRQRVPHSIVADWGARVGRAGAVVKAADRLSGPPGPSGSTTALPFDGGPHTPGRR